MNRAKQQIVKAMRSRQPKTPNDIPGNKKIKTNQIFKNKMSLFKVVSWWNAQCSELSKKYDSASLHCCRLGLEDNEKDYVVVGSHSGHLSIFRPSSEMLEDGTLAGFTPNSLVLEVKLSQPVIGIISGKFTT